jgi:ADP-ribosyl-[dinitrogen reductase] hydrolase
VNEKLSRKNRAMGAIMGALVGDALGVGPHWYYDLDQLKADYGEWIRDYRAPLPNRYHAGLKAGENSQTGQVFTLLLESVSTRRGYDKADFTRRLDDLLATLDGSPRGGRYTDIAMRDIWHARRAGLDWAEAGSFADTAEAATRMPVLAARYSKDLGLFFEHAMSNVQLTHRDPFIVGRSVAFGLIVLALINAISLKDVSRVIPKWAGEQKISLTVKMPRAKSAKTPKDQRLPEASFIDAVLQPGWSYAAAHDPAVKIEPASAACRLFGLACTMGFMLPAAYYLAARFENNFETAVLSAINGGGNNMARAALTGALAGAQVGLQGIPERFINGLAQHDRLLELAERVADAAEESVQEEVCIKAPEWAEHYRLGDDDQPCDDGRSGKI